MTNKPLDPSKPVKLRNGWEAWIYKVFPEIGKIHIGFKDPNGYINVCIRNLDGSHIDRDLSKEYDLINIPERTGEHEGWVNIYSNGGIVRYLYLYLHDSKENADKSSYPHRIACIKIKFKEGDGL